MVAERPLARDHDADGVFQGVKRQPQMSFGRILAGSLLSLLAVAQCSSARSDDSESMRQRSADLASTFNELNFTGSVRIEDSGDECIYEIPALTIRFRKTEGSLTKTIQIDQFRVVVVASEEAKKAKGIRGYLLEQRYPLVPPRIMSKDDVRTEAFKFAIPKKLLRDADYLGFDVNGLSTLEDDGRYAFIEPVQRARILGGRRVAWPISARGNIASITTSGDGERGTIVYRKPRDPNDNCSSVKIR
jgi:hypothetical protein